MITTTYECPPVPVRSFDWSACFEGYEPGDPIGRGKTESDAIAELLLNLGD